MILRIASILETLHQVGFCMNKQMQFNYCLII